MGLARYNQKRDFRRTPEPAGGGRGSVAKKGTGRAYLIQKHDATRLHYDLRLQVGDVLASWAVPKGPSLDPAHKRLAVHVEDHPLGYGDFEGVIPKGEYGGGTVMLWDRGTWEPEDGVEPTAAIRKGKLSFTIRGEKLSGGWTLTRMKSRKRGDEDKDNWLLIKREDATAAEGDGLPRDDESIKTGRSMEEIAAGAAARGRGSGAAKGKKNKAGRRGNEAQPEAAVIAAGDPSKLAGARKGALPRNPKPQLATLVDEAPAGDRWIHEIKFDGYRLLAVKSTAGVRLITRGGKDWASKFAPIAGAVEALPVNTAILDGEAAIVDRRGHTSFQDLQNAVKAQRFEKLVFFVFDLIYLDGYDLSGCGLVERKELLRGLVPRTDRGVLRYSDHVEGSGEKVHSHACELALEGIISKRADARYQGGRSKSWVKVKCSRRQEFVIIGWTPPSGSRKHLGSLLLGSYDGDGLIYTGKVGTGFNAQTLKDLRGRMDALARKTCAADEPPDRSEARGARWVRPSLVAEVDFTQWTDDGRLRHPSFQGLREDKAAANVRIERPRPVEEVEKPVEKQVAEQSEPEEDDQVKRDGDNGGAKQARKNAGTHRSGGSGGKKRSAAGASREEQIVAGVRLSSADRVLYPDQGVTKLDLARYYEGIADRILPFIEGRPLSTVRCPSGRTGKCFYQKHIRDSFGDAVKAIAVEEESGEAEYISVDSTAGLVTLVQFGVLEIHPWGSPGDDLEHPDVLVLDMDPGEGASFELVKEGALRGKEAMEAEGLATFLKATGGKGLHVVSPLDGSRGWDEVKALAKKIAAGIAADDPKWFIATASKAKRAGKVYVDYLRNGRGATAIAPYSTRARAGAPVAVPLRWDELSRLESAAQYTVATITRRLAQLKGDPWEGYWGAAAMRKGKKTRGGAVAR